MSSDAPPPADVPDEATTSLLSAAASHDLARLTLLLKTHPATLQHPITLTTPLHAAVASLSPSASDTEVTAAEDTVRLLLQNGAIWNDLDANGETPGCVAWRLGGSVKELYELLVEAGVRAELLMGRLGGGWDALASDSESEAEDGEKDVTSSQYLDSSLHYDDAKLLDADDNGVMMAWEAKIMQRSVAELLPTGATGKRVLNVGFGMGIVDSAFQERLREMWGEDEDVRHTIVEAHPDVLKKLRQDGWYEKRGVEVLEGRWQEVFPYPKNPTPNKQLTRQALAPIIAAGTTFDAIYFDTFAEEYTALKEFFTEYVLALLSPDGGRFSFFHGLGADRRVSWDVYTRVVELDLLEAGLDTIWTDVEIELPEQTWTGVRRRYWDVGGVYRLPVCTFVG
ncbi:S-adenosyl-L-methionine-dependent methyltransferase [Sphaerosporella brunnea]|uniref:Arginine N-methyltransferase 2 n=1 Tax=Sphaerosporella brunnea TaxID=1250544 RepID=A0A5J5ET64_9PEZI|nr:S-adenosyl-L-methionine-dependent methyltransferase [Sphaerosporella brunnea]